MDRKKIKSFVKQIQDFYDYPHPDKILMFGYYLQNKETYDCFTGKDILKCYSVTSTPKPKNITDSLNKLSEANRIIKENDCYVVAGLEVQNLEENILGGKPLISIKDELKELPSKMPEPEQSEYVEDILGCLQVKAWRAAIVMTWILTLDHLQRYVLANKKDEFNSILQSNHIYRNTTVNEIRDFENIKDSDFIVVLRTCGIIGSSQLKKLKNRLDDRNAYAHPTDLKLTDTMAISFIEDLIHNIILKIM